MASPTMLRLRPYLIPLIAAASLNVPIAWGCILWSPYTHHSSPSEQLADDGWPVTNVGPDGNQGYWFAADGFGVSQAVPHGARGHEDGFAYFRGEHTPAYYRGGWPMHSMQSVVTARDGNQRWKLPTHEIIWRGMQTNWLPKWLHALADRRLPIVQYWPGFAINTLLYFGVFVALRWAWLRVVARLPAREGFDPVSLRSVTPTELPTISGVC